MVEDENRAYIIRRVRRCCFVVTDPLHCHLKISVKTSNIQTLVPRSYQYKTIVVERRTDRLSVKEPDRSVPSLLFDPEVSKKNIHVTRVALPR